MNLLATLIGGFFGALYLGFTYLGVGGAVMIAFIVGLALAGCTAVIDDPLNGSVMGKCYAGVFNSFCVVTAPPGTMALSGVPILPTIILAPLLTK